MGCENCNGNCKKACERVVITKQGERGFQGPPGQQGPPGIQGPAGPQGASGVDLYDSGWITLNDYDGGKGYGLPAYSGGKVHPKIRVIGKHVYIAGIILIPLSDDSDAGTTLITDETLYPTTHKDKVRVYEGAAGGFTSSTIGSIESTSPIIPAALLPITEHYINQLEFSSRPVKNVANTHSLVLSTVLPNISFRTTGKLFITTYKDLDDSALQGGGGAVMPNSPLHMMISKVVSGDTAPDYTNYKTAYTGAADQRTSPDSTIVYPATFDGEDETHLGAFTVNFTFNYPLGVGVTQSAIQAAIAEIQA